MLIKFKNEVLHKINNCNYSAHLRISIEGSPYHKDVVHSFHNINIGKHIPLMSFLLQAMSTIPVIPIHKEIIVQITFIPETPSVKRKECGKP